MLLQWTTNKWWICHAVSPGQTHTRSPEPKFISISCIVTNDARPSSNTKTKKFANAIKMRQAYWKKRSKEMHGIICEPWWKMICWPQAHHLQFAKTFGHTGRMKWFRGTNRQIKTKHTPFLTALSLSVRVHLIGGFAVAHFNYFEQQATKAKHYKHLSLAPWFE